VQVWSAATGTTLATYTNPSDDPAYALAWSPDGTRIAAGYGYGGGVAVLDEATGKVLLGYQGTFYHLFALAWSHDGTRIVSGGGELVHPQQGGTQEQGGAEVWQATTGDTLVTFGDTLGFPIVYGLAWSPDSKRVAFGDDAGAVQLGDPSTGTILFTYHGHTQTINSVAWSPDGRRIASGSADGTVQIWSAG
jgi:eukaryotic-like serine/threonine-protein kinase